MPSFEPISATTSRLRVERDAEARLHVTVGGGLAEARHARRTTGSGGVAGRAAALGQRRDDVRRRRQIGIADAEVDEVGALLALLRS